MTPTLGQEIYLKPGISGYGYYSPDSSSERFRLRQSIWNFSNWFYLGMVTDTASPDLKPGGTKDFLEYQDGTGEFKYILLDGLESGLEFHDPATPTEDTGIDFEVTIVKPPVVPVYKRYLGQIIAGVLAAAAIVYLAVKAQKKKKKTSK